MVSRNRGHPEKNMSAYIIAEVTVNDAGQYEKYKPLVAPTLVPYGGKYIARGGAAQRLEGGRAAARMVIIEFPDAQKARAWWESEEYAAAKGIRQAAADTDMILVEGLE